MEIGEIAPNMRGRSCSYSPSPSPPRRYSRRRHSLSPRGRYRGCDRDLPTSLLVRNLNRDCRYVCQWRIFALAVVFSDMVENCIEVFMDDFSVFGSSFDCCLANLELVLQRCEETNLVLNWEKCHFMVQQGIVLGHKISLREIEVDKAKNDVIEKLPPPINVKGVRKKKNPRQNL